MAYYNDAELDFHQEFFLAALEEGDRVYVEYGLHMRIELYTEGWELS